MKRPSNQRPEPTPQVDTPLAASREALPPDLLAEIRSLIEGARERAAQAVNTELVALH